ncbi:MAG: hypothetical protein K5865_00915 [Eubacterium sp.]|nr:hypothetical protein [Eubacterium sp.]
MQGKRNTMIKRIVDVCMTVLLLCLMGLHLGLHILIIFSKLKLKGKVKIALSVISCVIAGIGLLLFLKSSMTDYLFFRVPFAFLDYEKAGILVLLENLLMLIFWSYIGVWVAILCSKLQTKTYKKKEN